MEENNATYPEKINSTKPQHLSLEALEMHYRIHASILKYLELHEGKPILSNIGKIFKKLLNSSVLPKKINSNIPKVLLKEPGSFSVEDYLVLKEVYECLDDLLLKVEKISPKAPSKMETGAAEEGKGRHLC